MAKAYFRVDFVHAADRVQEGIQRFDTHDQATEWIELWHDARMASCCRVVKVIEEIVTGEFAW